jgi:hypothetical protein
MVKLKKRVVREKREPQERVKKDPPLLDKPKKYKIGDQVKVEFLNMPYLCTITNLRFRDDIWPKRWTYYCVVDAPVWAKGTKFPNCGINNTEEDCNIVGKL